jgi:hypothetical protein
LPQGFSKKIEIQLLLADLAFQFGNSLLCRGKIVTRRRWSSPGRHRCGRPPPRSWSQRLWPAGPKRPAPVGQVPPIQLKLAAQCRRPFPSQQPAHCVQLELLIEPAVLLVLAVLRHQFSPENWELLSVSHFWGPLHRSGKLP